MGEGGNLNLTDREGVWKRKRLRERKRKRKTTKKRVKNSRIAFEKTLFEILRSEGAELQENGQEDNRILKGH